MGTRQVRRTVLSLTEFVEGIRMGRLISHLDRVVVASLVGGSLFLNALPAAAQSPGGSTESTLSGMRRMTSGSCAGAFQIVGTNLCSHGPDPVPEAVQARGAPRAMSSVVASQLSTSVGCDGDGESGKRVEALYVRVAGRPDRRSTYLASFRTWAAKVDAMLQASAADSGGHRRLRWVTNDDCHLVVRSVTLSAAAETSFAATIAELTALGYNRADRKYLIWFDSDPRISTICGVGTVYVDDKPALNLNDTETGYARADFMCWNWSEPHELMHTLGGVQPSAPHATANLHCTDEYDHMCYPDGPTAVMTYPCPVAYDDRFDCGHDDYFSASPAPNSYLATHWNTADSGWLVTDPADTVAPVATPPETSFVTGETLGSSARVRVEWSEASDGSGIAGYQLQRRQGSGEWAEVPLARATATSVDLDLAVGATHTFRVRPRDRAGNTGSWATAAAATLALVQESAPAIVYTGTFKRVTLSGASGGYVRKAGASGRVATFSFSGSDVAFVTTRGSNRGIATARADGGTPQTMDLYRPGTQTRYVAWAASVGGGDHSVEVRVTGTGNASAAGTRIDIDAFLVWQPV